MRCDPSVFGTRGSRTPGKQARSASLGCSPALRYSWPSLLYALAGNEEEGVVADPFEVVGAKGSVNAPLRGATPLLIRINRYVHRL